jgi:4-amino-4-deoxy-L-arabinose transferase-like glycosyltransferase
MKIGSEHTSTTSHPDAGLHTDFRSARVSYLPFILLIAAFAVNLAAIFLLRRNGSVATLEWDEYEYWTLAGNILSGGIDTLPARRTLPFPLLLAGIRSLVGDDYLHVQIILSAILSVGPLLIYWLVREHLQSERVGRLAAVGFLLWPTALRYNATLYSDPIALVCFIWFLIAFQRAEAVTREDATGASWWRWLLAGGVLALCIEMKPLYLFYTPIAFLLAFASAQGFNLRARAAVLLTAGCLAVVLPWSTWISLKEGHFILISTNDGDTLAGGLNPKLLELEQAYPTGTDDKRMPADAWVGPGKWLNPNDTGYLTPEELKLPPDQTRDLLLERSTAWIKSHPLEVAYLTVRKLLYMWGIYPLWNSFSQSVFGNFLLLPLMAAAGLALWKSRRKHLHLAMYWTLPIFCSAVACISWGSWRFRMPGDLGLIVLAATLALYAPKQLFLSYAIDWLRRMRAPSATALSLGDR